MLYVFEVHRMILLEINCVCLFTEQASVLKSKKKQKLKHGAALIAAQELMAAE